MIKNEAIDIQSGKELARATEQARNIGETAMTYETATRGVLEVAMVTDLGPNNDGNFGPIGEAEVSASKEQLQDLAKPEYAKRASSSWICVDGRCSYAEIAAAEAGESDEADQIGRAHV